MNNEYGIQWSDLKHLSDRISKLESYFSFSQNEDILNRIKQQLQIHDPRDLVNAINSLQQKALKWEAKVKHLPD